jgi:hypothetical protein
MTDRAPEPIVFGRLSFDGVHVYIRCPWCDRIHVHGSAGLPLPDSEWPLDLGYRGSHCVRILPGLAELRRDYHIIVPAGSFRVRDEAHFVKQSKSAGSPADFSEQVRLHEKRDRTYGWSAAEPGDGEEPF